VGESTIIGLTTIRSTLVLAAWGHLVIGGFIMMMVSWQVSWHHQFSGGRYQRLEWSEEHSDEAIHAPGWMSTSPAASLVRRTSVAG
jgi:hypothetical protein